MAYIDHEVLQEGETVDRVVHLGVELDGIGLLAFNLIAGKAHAIGRADYVIVVGQALDSVAMTHPDLTAGRDVLHQGVGAVDELQIGTAIFADLRLLDTAATIFGQILSSVANSQQREFAFNGRHIGHRSIGGVTAIGAT